MKIVILGSAGQLGGALTTAFADASPVGLNRPRFDVESAAAIATLLRLHRPDLVINTSAFHDVELCETRPDRAFAVNALAVDALAGICAAAGVAFAQISTDYVFDGERDRPYREDDATAPLSVYGASKLAGEHLARLRNPKHFVFRTSGLYGGPPSAAKGPSFVERMLALAAAGKPIRVVDDVVSSPSYVGHVAGAIRAIVERGAYGTYHVVNTGACSWYDFASEIFRQRGLEPDLSATTQAAFPSIARRPRSSALDNAALRALGVAELPTWQGGLEAYFTKRDGASA